MLQIDLNRLRRDGRVRIDRAVPVDADWWGGVDLDPRSPLEVRIDAQHAGPDVVVRGRVKGAFGAQCRRCLEPVEVAIDEELGRLYREGEDMVAEESEDVLALPPGSELDLTEPIRETVLLAVPRFVSCREECKGLCPQCGTNLNVSSCECTMEVEDHRWAPLRRLTEE